MKKVVFLVMLLGWMGRVNGVSFTRYTIDSVFNRPHGDWAGNVQSTNPCVKDAFGTSGLDHQVYWWANQGNGTLWGARNVIQTGPLHLIPFEVVAGDLDNDGDIDAVSSHLSMSVFSHVYLHNNNGAAVFSTTLLDTFKARARQLRVYDINNDGRLDIVVAGNSQGGQSLQNGIGVYWYENTGGNNPPTFTQHYLGTTSNPWKLDCFDAEGDGHLEIVATEDFCAPNGSDPGRLVVYKNNGAEVFTMTGIDSYTNGETVGGPRCADFNGDGLVDIVAGDNKAGILYWYKNQNTSGTSFQRFQIDANCPVLDGICMCDPDRDGDWDIFVAGRYYWFRWYENDGNGNFTSQTIETAFEQLDLPYTTYLDGDSCCDVILSVDNVSPSTEPGYFFAYLNPCPTGVEEKERFSASNWLKVPSIIGNNSTEIEYNITGKGLVRLEVMDLTGRIIQVLDEGYYSQPGIYRTAWNLTGKPNGVYILRLVHGDTSPIVKKTIVIRER